jgi:hypothetical protein
MDLQFLPGIETFGAYFITTKEPLSSIMRPPSFQTNHELICPLILNKVTKYLGLVPGSPREGPDWISAKFGGL